MLCGREGTSSLGMNIRSGKSCLIYKEEAHRTALLTLYVVLSRWILLLTLIRISSRV